MRKQIWPWAGRELLPKAKEFKYLEVLLMGEGRVKDEIDVWFGAVSAVMRALRQTLVVKRELCQKALNLLVHLSPNIHL